LALQLPHSPLADRGRPVATLRHLTTIIINTAAASILTVGLACND
jgi:hypothetical protein